MRCLKLNLFSLAIYSIDGWGSILCFQWNLLSLNKKTGLHIKPTTLVLCNLAVKPFFNLSFGFNNTCLCVAICLFGLSWPKLFDISPTIYLSPNKKQLHAKRRHKSVVSLQCYVIKKQKHTTLVWSKNFFEHTNKLDLFAVENIWP